MEEFNIKQDLLSVTRLALYVCLYVCLFNSDASGFSQIIQASIINVSFEEPVSVVFPFQIFFVRRLLDATFLACSSGRALMLLSRITIFG